MTGKKFQRRTILRNCGNNCIMSRVYDFLSQKEVRTSRTCLESIELAYKNSRKKRFVFYDYFYFLFFLTGRFDREKTE